jgi:hypothetical protein
VVVSVRGYRTELSLPLVGLSSEAVLNEVQSVLEVDGRVDELRPVPGCYADDEPVEHVVVSIRLSAPSVSDAEASAADLYDIALRAVLAMLPPTSQVGWTSGYEHPEPV